MPNQNAFETVGFSDDSFIHRELIFPCHGKVDDRNSNRERVTRLVDQQDDLYAIVFWSGAAFSAPDFLRHLIRTDLVLVADASRRRAGPVRCVMASADQSAPDQRRSPAMCLTFLCSLPNPQAFFVIVMVFSRYEA
jgi:hypothetical protein